MLVAPDSTSMVVAGLDHWYTRDGEAADGQDIRVEEFQLEEWRLQRRLGVSHFRLPPDYRGATSFGPGTPNERLTVPCLRFPQWHFCWRCKRLDELPLSAANRRKCKHCLAEGKTSFLAQVPIVAVCELGHLQDFPWNEWVHHNETPSCQGALSLFATGGATLANQLVRCACGASRNLSGVLEIASDGKTTTLSSALQSGQTYNCRGKNPQHGDTEGAGCDRPLKGSLRAASNLYFGVVRSAIYLPRASAAVPAALLDLLGTPQMTNVIMALYDSAGAVEASLVRSMRDKELATYKNVEIAQAIALLIAAQESSSDLPQDGGEDPEVEEDFRRAEAEVLRADLEAPELVVRTSALDRYGPELNLFRRVQLVDRLRETRVLDGFNRIFPDRHLDRQERAAQLWRKTPSPKESWLPAFCVYGEGLYLELDEDAVQRWEVSDPVVGRAQTLQGRYEAARGPRQLTERALSPRFLLVHTLAHVLMNQLTFDCGYSSAALRERLYVTDAPGSQLAAVLIYTAAGDAEGTMGGLVRMGKPNYLEGVLRNAVAGARWCAADPVCMEIGSSAGQGPDSCNLAACHSCGLVPETACEEFNRFLDRGLLVGTPERPNLGFFGQGYGS